MTENMDRFIGNGAYRNLNYYSFFKYNSLKDKRWAKYSGDGATWRGNTRIKDNFIGGGESK